MKPGDVDLDALQQRLRAMPARMRELKQWLLWRFEPNPKRPEKPLKVPYYVSGRRRRGAQGTVEDREALSAFEPALAELVRGRWDGVGFAFLPGDGLIGIDIDRGIDGDTGEISKRCQAIVDACASYTETSPSGTGVHIIVDGTTVTFKDNKVGVEVFCGRQYFTCTGRHWPGSPAEVQPISEETLERLRKLVSASRERKPAVAASAPVAQVEIPLRDKLEDALRYVSPDPNYEEWVVVGMSLKHALGEAGLALWDYWSSKGAKYPGSDALQAKWASFRGASGKGTATEATIFKLAMNAGWKPPKRASRLAQRLVEEGAGGGSTPSERSAEGEEVPDPPDGRSWRDELLRSNGGKKDCRENVFMVLANHPQLAGLVGYDEFAHRVLKMRTPPWKSAPGEWTTNDDYMLGFWLAKHERLIIKGEGTIVAGVAMAALHNSFHPVHRYLEGLPVWDGTERLGFWLAECLGAEEGEYTRLVGSWFVMGMVKRVLEPGCQMDYMVVLEGLQGKQKSTALRTLVGNDAWFADTPIRVGDKDAMLSLAGIWLYEIGELESFNKAEVTAVKQYVSSRIDRVREPFARRPSDRRRSGVFAGSTNASEYFKDPTGARRFWPVACNGEVNLAKLREWRDQLFAEAMHRLASADENERRYWPTREETKAYLVEEQEKRQIVDPWYEKLAVWLESRLPYGDDGAEIREVKSFTSYELLLKALNVPVDRIDGARQMATRVGTAMHALGWTKQRDSTGARVWRYYRPQAQPQAAAPAAAVEEERLHEF
jgi:putative DNA primase/helicase